MNDTLKKIQKESGIKMGKYDNDKNRLYHWTKAYLQSLKLMVKEAEELKLTDEQFWIDFENELNLISIKDHNDSQRSTSKI